MTTVDAVVRDRRADCADRPAVVDAAGTISYRELFAQAGELAAVLAARPEAGTNRLVAVQLGRDRTGPVAMLAVLLAGCAFVPVDPTHPVARREMLLADCDAQLIVVTEGAEPAGSRLIGSAAGARVYVRDTGRPRADLPDDLAYVIYTSGTTGEPKGCMVGHAQVLALFDHTAAEFDLGPDDVWSAFHSFSFDFSVWEIWGALLFGGATVVVPPRELARPDALLDLIGRHGVTVLSLTPSMFAHVAAEAVAAGTVLPRVRLTVLGGEAVRLGDVRTWVDHEVAPGGRVVNMYGITEITVHATQIDVTGIAVTGTTRGIRRGSTPIGDPLKHLAISIRDAEGHELGPGAEGEIWVSGAGVIAGYLGRPDLTAARFVTVAGPGGAERHYRSGDAGFRAADGSLHCTGRLDNQVKLRGFRVELGEIEATLRRVPGLRDAACTVERNDLGNDLLVAYVVDDRARTDCELRDDLRRTLPHYMIPQLFVRRTVLPVSVNGKLDRAALSVRRRGLVAC
ncbi:amino acid adenylation domain-containing protein [Micromonosporaceae bacterium Da 78-11]